MTRWRKPNQPRFREGAAFFGVMDGLCEQWMQGHGVLQWFVFGSIILGIGVLVIKVGRKEAVEAELLKNIK